MPARSTLSSVPEMPSQSRPAIRPIGNGGKNGGTITGVPGTGTTPITMPGAEVSHMIPITGFNAMPVTGPPSAAITPGAITNGGTIGPAGGKLGLGIDASIRPLLYQVMPVIVLVVASPGTGIIAAGGGSNGTDG